MQRSWEAGSWWRVVIVIALLLAVAIRLVQYLGHGSFWFDELALVLAFEPLSLAEVFTRPLSNAQVAPSAFVVAVKLCARVLGANEFGYRAVTLLSALATPFLFLTVARRFLAPPAMAAALLIIAGSPALTWYGGNVKPYAGDVAIGLLLVLFALRHLEAPTDGRRAWTSGLIGAAVIPLSFPAVTTAALLGAMLTWRVLFRPGILRQALWPMLLPWALAAAVTGLFALRLVDEATQVYMDRFWAKGYMPPPWRDAEALFWLPKQLSVALTHFQYYLTSGVPGITALSTLVALLALYGIVRSLRDARLQAFLMLAPVIAAVVGAMAQLFPLDGRVSLYIGWPLLLAMCYGLQDLWRRGPGVVRVPTLLAGVLLALSPISVMLLYETPPYRFQHVRPVMGSIADAARPEDKFLAYFGARHAVAYYGPRMGLADWQVGSCHREEPRGYFREVDAYRGEPRVWLLFTHASLGYREPEVILEYLDAIGTQLLLIPDPSGEEGQGAAFAVLYDLSDPTRLALADAATFVHGEILEGGVRILCDGTRVMR